MVHSFLNKFLPKDEYRRKKILYFMAEALLITVIVLLLLGTLTYLFSSFSVNGDVLLFLSPFLILAYVNFRYVFTGMEFPEVFQKKTYKQERRRSILRSLLAGVIFTISLFIVKGIPSNISESLDIIIPIILFLIFYYFINIISLKRSIKKNEQLDD